MKSITRQTCLLGTMPIQRIAILRALQLGDLLLAVPALRAIRSRFPAAEITLIGLPWAEDFARRFARYVDRFVAFPGYPGIAEAPYAAARTARFFAAQRAYGYDLAIQMHGDGTASNGFCLELGARMTAGYYDAMSSVPCDSLTFAAPYPAGAHEIARNLGLAQLLGAVPRTAELEFPLRSADIAEAARLLRPLAGLPRPWIGLHAGARAASRRWPAERFAAVVAELARREGATIILTGGPDEVETVDRVAGLLGIVSSRAPKGEAGPAATGPLHVLRASSQPSRASSSSPSPHRQGGSRSQGSALTSSVSSVPSVVNSSALLNLAGRTSLGALAAVIRQLDLYITNDTGPSHLAEAVGTPSITLFGPADPRRWAPLDAERHPILRGPVACSPCGFDMCPIDHACLRRIPAARVVALAERLLHRGASACCNA